MHLLQIWDLAKEKIKEKIGTTSYETWFSNIQAKEKNAETIIIETPDDFFKNWIVEHYGVFIQEAINDFSQKHICIEFLVNSQILKQETKNRLSQFEQNFKEVDSSRSILNARFTFDNFVIGKFIGNLSSTCQRLVNYWQNAAHLLTCSCLRNYTAGFCVHFGRRGNHI